MGPKLRDGMEQLLDACAADADEMLAVLGVGAVGVCCIRSAPGGGGRARPEEAGRWCSRPCAFALQPCPEATRSTISRASDARACIRTRTGRSVKKDGPAHEFMITGRTGAPAHAATTLPAVRTDCAGRHPADDPGLVRRLRSAGPDPAFSTRRRRRDDRSHRKSDPPHTHDIRRRGGGTGIETSSPRRHRQRIIAWLDDLAPLGGGATGPRDEAFAAFIDGMCSGPESEPVDQPGEPFASVYSGADAACLAAFHGRPDGLLARGQGEGSARSGGRSRDGLQVAAVLTIAQSLLKAHAEDPDATLIRGQSDPSGPTCPILGSLEPDHGPPGGGYPVRLIGKNLPAIAVVNLVEYYEDGPNILDRTTKQTVPTTDNGTHATIIMIPGAGPRGYRGAGGRLAVLREDEDAGILVRPGVRQHSHAGHPHEAADADAFHHSAGKFQPIAMTRPSADRRRPPDRGRAPTRRPPPSLAPAASTEAGTTMLTSLQRIAVFGSPVVLASGLLFYYGWVRATTQARDLGYEITVLPLSTTDYR